MIFCCSGLRTTKPPDWIFSKRAAQFIKKFVLCAAPVHTAGQRLPLEGKLAAKPTDEVANKELGKSRNFRQKRRISTSSAQCAHWAPSPPGEGLRRRSPSSRCVFLTDWLKHSCRGTCRFHPCGFSGGPGSPGRPDGPASPRWQTTAGYRERRPSCLL